MDLLDFILVIPVSEVRKSLGMAVYYAFNYVTCINFVVYVAVTLLMAKM